MAKSEQHKELVFIPMPLMGHLPATVQLAQKLVSREDPSGLISATILIVKFPHSDDKIDSYIKSLKSNKTIHHRISILELPPSDSLVSGSGAIFMSLYLEAYKPVVKQALLDRYYNNNNSNQSQSTMRLGGLVLDMFTTNMIDVGDELGVPSYIFFTSGASSVSLANYFEGLGVNIPSTFGGLSPENTAVELGGFQNPVPMKVWPAGILDKDGIGRSEILLGHVRRSSRAQGFLLNTFMELESSIIHFLSSSSSMGDADEESIRKFPPVYPVGPILTAVKDDDDESCSNLEIIRWLDSQPPSSVVFLCFGSMGSFELDQVKEIAVGLERSGHRFLWSLRSPPTSDDNNKETTTTRKGPGEYDVFNEVLPVGFLNRTAEIGKVIGWAPQVAVLAHKSVGAFVSHCGWNSTLESLWFGVPMLTWPMYAEQQLNAFLLVKELGLAIEIRMDYMRSPGQRGANMIVTSEEVEKAIRKMMEEEDGEKVRRKVKEMSVMSRAAVVMGNEENNNGSSWEFMGKFVTHVIGEV